MADLSVVIAANSEAVTEFNAASERCAAVLTARIARVAACVIVSLPLLVGCGETAKSDPAEKSVAQSAPAQSQSSAPVDACTLLTKTDLQAIVGKPVLDGMPDQAAELATCAYGNPSAPQVGGRPTDVLVTLGVFTGAQPSQAKGAFDIAKKNAAEVDTVSGIGDEAFWDKYVRSLRVVKGNHLVDVSVGADLGDLKTARAIAEQALAKLP